MERESCFGDSFVVQWHLTDRCNLRCRHCYRAGPLRASMSDAESRALLDDIVELGQRLGEPVRIHFAGGEPFASDRLLPLMEEAGRRGVPSRVLSNGTIIDEAAAGRLRAAGCVGVQVSIEGGRTRHDSLRGDGSFDAALVGTARLRSAGVPVTFAMTLHRENAADLDAVLALAAAHADRAYFSRLIPTGQAAQGLRLLHRREWLGIMRRLVARSRRGTLPIALRDPTFRPLFAAAGPAAHAPVIAGCAAGYAVLAIEADGAIMPCRRIGMVIGHAGERRLHELWRTSEVLAALRDRDRLQGACGRCSYRWVCGGCRAVPHAMVDGIAARAAGESGLMAADPQCPWPETVVRLRNEATHLLSRLKHRVRSALGVAPWS